MGALRARMIDELGYDPDQRDEDDARAGRVPLATLDLRVDVPVGALVAARDGAREVAVARLASGAVVIVDDECPHDGGRISDGYVAGDKIVCARHGWELVACGRRCERAIVGA